MKNFNIENVMNGNASAEEVKALLAQIIEKNENVIKKEVSLSVEQQMRMEITENIKELYGKDRVIESDDKKFVLIDTGKKNHFSWVVTVEKISKKDTNEYSESAMHCWNGGDYRNLPTDVLKEKVFKDVPFEYFTYSVPPIYDGASNSNNEMFKTLIESDLIENLKIERKIKHYPNQSDDMMLIEVSFDLPLLIKNEVIALMASNYVKWIEYLQHRKNCETTGLSRKSVKEFVLNAVFEQEE